MYQIKSMVKQRNVYGWLFSIPAIAGILIFIVYPIFFSTYGSFTNWHLLFKNVKFVGFDNYKWLFDYASSKIFWDGLVVSLKFSFITTLLQTVIGFFLAYILYNMTKKLQAIYRVLLYLPVILPAAVVAVMWRFIYQPEYGLLDQLLKLIGLGNLDIPWIYDKRFALGSVIFTNTWRFIGVTIIIYFVAMNSVDKSVVESARMDGAGKLRTLFQIFLPLTWSSTQVNVILSIIGGIKSFDLFFLLTNGDAGTTVVGLAIYKTAFEYKQFARAIVMSLVLTVIITIITIFVNNMLKRGETDGAE